MVVTGPKKQPKPWKLDPRLCVGLRGCEDWGREGCFYYESYGMLNSLETMKI